MQSISMLRGPEGKPFGWGFEIKTANEKEFDIGEFKINIAYRNGCRQDNKDWEINDNIFIWKSQYQLKKGELLHFYFTGKSGKFVEATITDYMP
jgi:hypothetical protein